MMASLYQSVSSSTCRSSSPLPGSLIATLASQDYSRMLPAWQAISESRATIAPWPRATQRTAGPRLPGHHHTVAEVIRSANIPCHPELAKDLTDAACADDEILHRRSRCSLAQDDNGGLAVLKSTLRLSQLVRDRGCWPF